MQIHAETLSQIDRYMDKFDGDDLRSPHYRLRYDNYLNFIRPYVRIGPDSRLLEIGPGTGWFPIMCAMNGLRCRGLEISQQLIRFSAELARRHGVDVDIELGNIEENEIGAATYDVIIAGSVFEHVERWKPGLERVYKALKPGGVFVFSSSNKFSLTSSEYGLPLYGWLPDQWRYKLRMAMQGPDVMELGIDFNQFTYPGLRREFRRIGFSRIDDRFDRLRADELSHPLKRMAHNAFKMLPPAKALALTLSRCTVFVCVK
jgi:2-polyprenyl-3-methyl-5-hydroxy-6-metoxy-1,4-benzoquinol methylase